MKTLKLSKPVRLTEQSAPVESLTFREEIVAGDLRGLKAKDITGDLAFDALTTIAGRLCGQPDALICKLCLEDYGEVADMILGFFRPASSGKTSTEPSP